MDIEFEEVDNGKFSHQNDNFSVSIYSIIGVTARINGNLDIDDLEQVISKMKELQREVLK